ncbi:hypothetical protein ACMGE7_01420 [Macrococcus equi]|uniref:hypothetical protein n=1 Tax=Macrococcus equi TaxID=3395462 RepID=UPI0039BE70E6
MKELIAGMIILLFILFYMFQYKIFGRTSMLKAKNPVSEEKRKIGEKAYANAFEYIMGLLLVFSLMKVLMLDSSKPINLLKDAPEVIYLGATILVLIFSYIKENKKYL